MALRTKAGVVGTGWVVRGAARAMSLELLVELGDLCVEVVDASRE